MIFNLVDPEIISNSSPLFIGQPGNDGSMIQIFKCHTDKKPRKKKLYVQLFNHNLLALPSQTQQWTPRRPLYTQRMWLNPKSSATKGIHEMFKTRTPNTLYSVECIHVNTLPLRAASITLIATVIRGQQSKQTSAPEQQYLTSS